MAGGPGSYVLGAEERKEVLDVLDGGNLLRYGTPGVDGFQAKVATFEKEMAERLGEDVSGNDLGRFVGLS